jgi:hypothetical protein
MIVGTFIIVPKSVLVKTNNERKVLFGELI